MLLLPCTLNMLFAVTYNMYHIASPLKTILHIHHSFFLSLSSFDTEDYLLGGWLRRIELCNTSFLFFFLAFLEFFLFYFQLFPFFFKQIGFK
jgi:hypothetical protein